VRKAKFVPVLFLMAKKGDGMLLCATTQVQWLPQTRAYLRENLAANSDDSIAVLPFQEEAVLSDCDVAPEPGGSID
jgi:hypothetical protein